MKSESYLKHVDKTKLTKAQLHVIEKCAITYVCTKDSRTYVFIIVPKDLYPAIDILAVNCRHKNCINRANPFIFAQGGSKLASQGNTEMRCAQEIFERIGYEITATKIRKFVSTLHGRKNVTNKEQKLFCQFLGHAIQMNENVYQECPIVSTVFQVGRFLLDVDKKGELFVGNVHSFALTLMLMPNRVSIYTVALTTVLEVYAYVPAKSFCFFFFSAYNSITLKICLIVAINDWKQCT